ncbi:MAG: DCC1-like thiol-disulfide oxidoreductase family protein [Myxococcota bacterium]
MLFTWGLYGWGVAAASALLLPTAAWERYARGPKPARVILDPKAGATLMVGRVLRRLDLRRNLTFVDRDEDLPPGVTPEQTERSLVLVDAKDRIYDGGRAWSAIVRRLPFPGSILGGVLALPPFRQLLDVSHRRLYGERHAVSEAFALPRDEQAVVGEPAGVSPAARFSPAAQLSPAARWARRRGRLASSAAGAFLFAVRVDRARHAATPVEGSSASPEAERPLGRAAEWLQLTSTLWPLAPEPPRENGALVIDATTRSGWRVDLITGFPPDVTLTQPARARIGIVWEAYQRNIARPESEPFHREFRQYLTRGGEVLRAKHDAGYKIQSLRALWITRPIAAPERQWREPKAPVEEVEVFRYGAASSKKAKTPRPTPPAPAASPRP